MDPAIIPQTAEGFGLLMTTVLAAIFAMVMSISLAFLIENLRGRDADQFGEADPDAQPASGAAPATWPANRDDHTEVRRPTS